VATQRRDLRTGRVPWSHAATRRVDVAGALPSSRRVHDVVVVGSGVSGALVAHRLAELGFGVTILDRRGPACGATAASTALVLSEIDRPLVHLARRLGVQKAGQAWRRSRRSVDALASLVRGSGIRCGLATRPAVYIVGDLLDARDLRAECAARLRAGVPADFLSRRRLRKRFGLDAAGALVTEGNLALDPVRLTVGVLERATRRGVVLHAPCDVTGWKANAREVRVELDRRREIRCRWLVFCTGYELPHGLALEGHRIVSTWTIATAPQPVEPWRKPCLLWEASDPYLYVRSTSAGRILCGGEDEPFSDAARRDALIRKKAETLSEKLARLLPRARVQPALAWAGSFGVTPSGLPSIGRLPGHDRVLAVLGFGGNGITFSMLAAELVSAELRREPDPDARLFGLSREP
jgi:glycine/D-amino acid oxidase-like deaminating enzyme